MQSVVRAASLGQLARATATAVPPAGAALAKPVPPAGALPLVQAPGNFLWTRVLPYAPCRSLSISKFFWALKSSVSISSLVHKITNVPVVYLGLDIWIWMWGNPFLGAFEGVGPRYGLLPYPNPYVPPHINNRYNLVKVCHLI
jgi:hypothetical protein